MKAKQRAAILAIAAPLVRGLRFVYAGLRVRTTGATGILTSESPELAEDNKNSSVTAHVTGRRSAVAYYWVPCEDQARDAYRDMQLAPIKTYAAMHDYDLPDQAVFHDDGIPRRTRGGRPGASRAVDYAIAHKAALIIYAVSRLIRSAEEGRSVSRRLQEAGATLVSVVEDIDTGTAQGRFAFKMLLARDELEFKRIAERTSHRLQQLRADDQRAGTVPYGYMTDKTRPEIRPRTGQVYYPHLLVNPVEQTIIAQVRALQDKGLGPTKIAERLNKKGYRSRGGHEWTKQAVSQSLVKYGRE